jgi:23S rRNA pseudouridine1911/1915/1917 synthase
MLTNLTFFHPRWPVFHEDNHLLALYKPAGLLAQGDHTEAPNLLDLAKLWVKERHHKPGRVFLGLVHRLDRPVSGVMLFARTSKAASRLSAQFRDGSTQKVYLAVVEGKPNRRSGTLSHHIERRGRWCGIVPSATRHSREAHLHFQVIDSTAKRSLLQVALITGRKHQIRLQLAHTGHPLVGDIRYGARSPLASRQIALLAKELTIEHPTRKIPLRLVCPLPTDWPWQGPQTNILQPYWNWDRFSIGKDIRKYIEPANNHQNISGSADGT